jgi:hypothetical protein
MEIPQVEIIKKNRFLPNGKYDKTPNSPTYFRDYYRSHRVPTECQYCHLIFTGKDCLYKHGIRSKKCIKLRAELAQATASASSEETSSNNA